MTSVISRCMTAGVIIGGVLTKLISIIKSPKFFIFILALYLLQGLFFAVAVNPSDIYVLDDGTVTRGGGVVPDGNRHIGAIYYFAQQPIENGPFINDMADGDLWMGDLERFPSYLYYYIMGFFIRISMALGASDFVNVLIIRLIGLLIGLGVVWVFKKLVAEITANKAIVNLATFAMVITGSLAWLAPAENYDILALLFFFLFMLASLRLFTNKDPTRLYAMFLWFFLCSITKYTYLPFMGLFALVAVALYVYRTGTVKKAWRLAKEKIANRLASINKFVLIGLTAAMIVSGGLFAERIGVNLVQYHSISPDCDVIHTKEACMNFGVYVRNYERQQLVSSGDLGDYTFDPIFFTALWLYKYYTSMYAYVGHIWIDYFSPIMFVGFGIIVVCLALITVYLKRRKIKILSTLPVWYAFFVAAVLIGAQYIFNANSFIGMGGVAYATQGRYLLPAVGFVYVFVLMAIVKFLRSLPAEKRPRAMKLLVILAIIAVLTNGALPVFFMHATTPEWFSWT